MTNRFTLPDHPFFFENAPRYANVFEAQKLALEREADRQALRKYSKELQRLALERHCREPIIECPDWLVRRESERVLDHDQETDSDDD